MRRADHSSRGVLPTGVHCCVRSRNLKNEEAMAHDGPQRHEKNVLAYKCFLKVLITRLSYGEGSRENFIFLRFLRSWHYFVQAASINLHPIVLTTVHIHVIDCKLTVFLLRLNVNVVGLQTKLLNPLKTKRTLLYLKTQSVPRCKHFSSRL